MNHEIPDGEKYSASQRLRNFGNAVLIWMGRSSPYGPMMDAAGQQIDYEVATGLKELQAFVDAEAPPDPEV